MCSSDLGSRQAALAGHDGGHIFTTELKLKQFYFFKISVETCKDWNRSIQQPPPPPKKWSFELLLVEKTLFFLKTQSELVNKLGIANR